MTKSTLQKRIQAIRLVALDVDGVLTDGSIIWTGSGEEIKVFNVHDGAGIKYLERAGIQTAILSGRRAKPVTVRAKELGIRHVLQGFKFKMQGLEKLVNRAKVSPREICYVGDDLPDLPVMHEVGLAIAVPNARPEVRRAAHWVTRTRGGHGAVREVAEKILRGQKLWGRIIARYGLKGRGAAEGAL